ncbi:hypothetical protein ACI2LJ_27750 [Streptomyces sp. NPDC088090]|uniref:hypothetical protein n=1 Tax=Streptomyces sp. NPDC088090 TaxID=3365822 RepID=UPI003851714D
METYPLVLMVVMALATARVTRLVTRDRILQAPRRAVLRALPDDHLLAYLVVCDWCVSMYVGALAAVGGAWAGWWDWWLVPALAFAYSHVTGWLASREGED